MKQSLSIEELQHYFRERRDIEHYSDNFRLRIHRALSWLKKAETEDDLDIKFISLWVSFNAAYAKELDINVGDRAIFDEFLLRICALDKEQHVYHLVWKKFSQFIRLLLDNKFIFQPFWDFHNGKIDEKEYIKIEIKERERFLSALETQKTERILNVIFSRLYTLRNQLIHGGSTYNSSANREQLSDACKFLSLFMPLMLKIMMENHNTMDWGKPYYPFIKD